MIFIYLLDVMITNFLCFTGWTMDTEYSTVGTETSEDVAQTRKSSRHASIQTSRQGIYQDFMYRGKFAVAAECLIFVVPSVLMLLMRSYKNTIA